MNVRYKSPAMEEIVAAHRWYREQDLAIADRFLDALEQTVARIRRFPESSCPMPNGIRKAGMLQFPYVLHYLLREEEIIVYAVAHTHRKPEYWIKRID